MSLLNVELHMSFDNKKFYTVIVNEGQAETIWGTLNKDKSGIVFENPMGKTKKPMNREALNDIILKKLNKGYQLEHFEVV